MSSPIQGHAPGSTEAPEPRSEEPDGSAVFDGGAPLRGLGGLRFGDLQGVFSAPGQQLDRYLKDTLEQLVRSLHERSVAVDLETLADAMSETFRESSELRSEPLSEGERAFLLEETDLDADDLTEDARAATRLRVLRDRSEVNAALGASSLSTAEVSKLTGRPDSSIRRSAGTKDYYVLNPGDPRGLRFPAWQFTEGQAVPGLARILDALPDGTHPLVIERFMTTPRQGLDSRSAVDWLATGGDVEKVVQLADDKGRE